jgi:hypothetical protein
MKRYVTYDLTSGKVLQSGTIQDELFVSLSTDTVGVVETPTQIDPNQWRVVAGELVSLPERPDGSYAFNYTTGQWEDTRTLEQVRSEAWERVKQGRDTAAAQGFDWEGHQIQTDTKSLANLTAVLNAYQISGVPASTTLEWTTGDNQQITITVAQLQDIVSAAGLFIKNLHEQSQLKRQEIDSATDFSAIDAIVF